MGSLPPWPKSWASVEAVLPRHALGQAPGDAASSLSWVGLALPPLPLHGQASLPFHGANAIYSSHRINNRTDYKESILQAH